MKPHSVPKEFRYSRNYDTKVKFRRGSGEGGRTGQVGREHMRLRLKEAGGRWEAGKNIIPRRTMWLTDVGGGLAYGAEPGGREVSGGWWGLVVKGDRAKTERGD